ncbi:alpha/beta hydrolase [Zhihengliuella alba]|uniref:Alpha/beta hydrolase n=1 Tax=Zhihengliuella alba TaxID=547018 RepID=A0ABP7D942_9MICC
MDVILVPGFWLDADSWGESLRPLKDAGHRVMPLTLPGKESPAAGRAGIGLRDHVDAVVDVVDSAEEPVVLVGHSGGGAIIHAVADARPDRVAHCIYVDALPLGEGGVINDEFPSDGDSIPLPGWDAFEEADLRDLSDELRQRFRSVAVPEPVGVATEQQRLGDERRFDVPATVIACEFSENEVLEFIRRDSPFTAELAKIKTRRILELPTGHWPQFTRPDELGELLARIVAAVDGADGPAEADRDITELQRETWSDESDTAYLRDD